MTEDPQPEVDGEAQGGVNDAATIDELLASSADRARKSFDEHIELGHKAMRRLVDPKSEGASVADDVQLALGLLARDAMLAIDTWNRLIYFSREQKEP